MTATATVPMTTKTSRSRRNSGFFKGEKKAPKMLRSAWITIGWTDGPDHNVIKMKPPLCLSESDVDRVVAAYDRVLGEDFVRSK